MRLTRQGLLDKEGCAMTQAMASSKNGRLQFKPAVLQLKQVVPARSSHHLS